MKIMFSRLNVEPRAKRALIIGLVVALVVTALLIAAFAAGVIPGVVFAITAAVGMLVTIIGDLRGRRNRSKRQGAEPPAPKHEPAKTEEVPAHANMRVG